MFTVEEIIEATEGKLIRGEGKKAVVKGVSINSRTLKKGELFIAIKGDRFDGHDFIRQVARKAAVLIVARDDRSIPQNIPAVLVKDTTIALGLLARYHRDRFKIPVIAITGSAGKTTTKEMVAAVLAKRYNVLKNFATHNNQIGLPMTLLKLKKAHDIVVVELGTNRFGDIRWLTKVANPTVALYTNIGESHLEFLKTPRGVFKEKFEMVKGMGSRGTVIFNNDDPYLRRIPRMTWHKLLPYGIEKDAKVRAGGIESTPQGGLRFTVSGAQAFTLRTPSIHNIYNALAAICCGRLFKIRYNEIKAAIARFSFPDGRGVIETIGPWRVIDDTYNANPVSLRSAIGTLSRLNTAGRKVLICGDMLELGKQSGELHRSMGRLAGQARLDMILTVGKFSRLLSQEARGKNKNVEAHHCPSLDAVHSRLAKYCRPGDTILVKGSRGMHMEKTIQFLKEKAKD